MYPSISEPKAGNLTLNPQEEAMLELFRSLGEAGRRELQTVAEEKKRLMDIERRLKELTETLADTNRPA